MDETESVEVMPASAIERSKIERRSPDSHGYSPLTSTDHTTPSGRDTTIAWAFSTVPVWPKLPSPNDIRPRPYHRPALG